MGRHGGELRSLMALRNEAGVSMEVLPTVTCRPSRWVSWWATRTSDRTTPPITNAKMGLPCTPASPQRLRFQEPGGDSPGAVATYRSIPERPSADLADAGTLHERSHISGWAPAARSLLRPGRPASARTAASRIISKVSTWLIMKFHWEYINYAREIDNIQHASHRSVQHQMCRADGGDVFRESSKQRKI